MLTNARGISRSLLVLRSSSSLISLISLLHWYPQWSLSWLGKDNALLIVLCSHDRPSLICARALTILYLQPFSKPAPVYELLCCFSLNTKRAALDDSCFDGPVQRRAQRVCTGAQKISVYDWLGLALLLSHFLH